MIAERPVEQPVEQVEEVMEIEEVDLSGPYNMPSLYDAATCDKTLIRTPRFIYF